MLRDSAKAIRSYNVTFFMASIDSLADNRAFAHHNRANFPILSDTTRQVSEAYGVLSESGYDRRWTFYIDPAGNIAHIDRNVRPVSAGDEILRQLEKLGVPPAEL